MGTGGSATVTPGVTIGAQIEETSVVATATVTLDSGIRVSLSQTTFTIGTNEQYLFSSANAFGPTVIVTGTSNQAVAWSVTSGGGTIDPNSGLYTAPSTPGTATVTVTSLADNTQFASATVNVVTAVDPTVTSISPPNGALGAAFQEVFITGNNFISTTNVFVNGSPSPQRRSVRHHAHHALRDRSGFGSIEFPGIGQHRAPHLHRGTPKRRAAILLPIALPTGPLSRPSGARSVEAR